MKITFVPNRKTCKKFLNRTKICLKYFCTKKELDFFCLSDFCTVQKNRKVLFKNTYYVLSCFKKGLLYQKEVFLNYNMYIYVFIQYYKIQRTQVGHMGVSFMKVSILFFPGQTFLHVFKHFCLCFQILEI